MNILPLFACFELLLPTVSVRQLAVVAQAILTMTGRITMLSISRWTEKGGSYRTVQRFFASVLPWSEMFAKFFAAHLFNSPHEYILAGDETVVSKSGKQTFGVDRFFSGLKGKVIRGLSFFVVSLVDTKERKSYPLCVKQMIKSESEKKSSKSRSKKRKAVKGGVKGRAKGSRNRDKNELKFSAELLRINELLVLFGQLVKRFMKVKYLAMDGHFGHHQAVLMARQNDLNLFQNYAKMPLCLRNMKAFMADKERGKSMEPD